MRVMMGLGILPVVLHQLAGVLRVLTLVLARLRKTTEAFGVRLLTCPEFTGALHVVIK
jgi:hypothetical protein